MAARPAAGLDARAARAGATRSGGAGGRRRPSWPNVVLAAIAYLPLLFTLPGKVGVDTKSYLYIDPGRLMADAGSMWDPRMDLGVVTHQNIGYLLPQGMFFWLFSLVGTPAWVAQRLWTGSVLFLAGAGVVFLMRSFRWPDRYVFIAALSYMLSPYVLEYEARMSAILLPYTGLGWLVGFTVRGLREAGAVERGEHPEPRGTLWRHLTPWRWPAAFAATTAIVGSSNASSLIFVELGPILWLPFAVWGTREVRLGGALKMIDRAVALTALCSAWWIGGLVTQAGYGVNILAFSETIQTVSSASQASEVLRGLGNWYFYGGDALGTWIKPSHAYTETAWVIAVSFAVPVLALAAGSCIRWGEKTYFVALVLMGTTIAVGAYPYDHPSPFGKGVKALTSAGTAGEALRSMPRAVPLVALGLGVLLAAGLAAFDARSARRAAARAGRATPAGSRLVSAALCAGLAVLVVANMSPLWKGQFVDSSLQRPEQIPSYEKAAAAALSAGGDSTRALELPGADFSHYRWGTTLDPVLPGLTTRPYVNRQLIPFGAASAEDLMRSFDRRLQEGVFETGSVADIARLMGVGTVVLRSNLQYERFRTPRPAPTYQLFTAPVPAGLTGPRTFGPAVPDTPTIPFTDETTLGESPGLADPPALALFGVTDPKKIVRSDATAAPLVVSGNGEGLVDAAADGILADAVARDRPIFYTAALSKSQLAGALSDGAELLVTDSNQLRAERWSSIRDGYGYTESPGSTALTKDPNDNRLPVFPGETTADQTVAQLAPPGQTAQISAVRATSYGNAFSYSPQQRPAMAVDNDAQTAWETGAFTNPAGEALQIDLAQPTTSNTINLLQPVAGDRGRWITQATLTFDGGAPMTVNLTGASRTGAGQSVTFPTRTFRSVQIRVDETNAGTRESYKGLSPVGFAEVRIMRADGSSPDVDEVLRLPTDLLTQTGAASLEHRLEIQLSRNRANPAEPFKADTEATMARVFTLPTPRAFALAGTARVSSFANDVQIDHVTGRDTTEVETSSSGRLPGDVRAASGAAFDGDPSTAWQTAFGAAAQQWIQVHSAAPRTISSIGLSIVADGRHSVPTQLGLIVDGRRTALLTVPPVTDLTRKNGVQTVTIPTPAVRGQTFRLEVEKTRAVTTKDPVSGSMIHMPVGLAEIDIAGLRNTPNAPTVPGECRTDLMTLDGKPVGVRVTGSSADALNRLGLNVSLCQGPVQLSAGTHILRTADGARTGYDLDRLLLSSDPGGGASTITPAGTVSSITTPVSPPPTVSVTANGDTKMSLNVTGATPGKPFWLVLGEGLNAGWHATVAGRDQGAPQLIDGYANGWLVTPKASSFGVSLAWTPQNLVWKALGISGATLLASAVVITGGGARSRRRRRASPDAGEPVSMPAAEPLTNRRLSPALAVPIAAVIGVVGLILVDPVAGLLTGLAALIGLTVPYGRIVMRIGSATFLTVAAVYVIQVQLRYEVAISGNWVQTFSGMAMISWMPVLLLAADTAVAAAQRRFAVGGPDPGPAGPAAPAPGSGPGGGSGSWPGGGPGGGYGGGGSRRGPGPGGPTTAGRPGGVGTVTRSATRPKRPGEWAEPPVAEGGRLARADGPDRAGPPARARGGSVLDAATEPGEQTQPAKRPGPAVALGDAPLPAAGRERAGPPVGRPGRPVRPAADPAPETAPLERRATTGRPRTAGESGPSGREADGLRRPRWVHPDRASGAGPGGVDRAVRPGGRAAGGSGGSGQNADRSWSGPKAEPPRRPARSEGRRARRDRLPDSATPGAATPGTATPGAAKHDSATPGAATPGIATPGGTTPAGTPPAGAPGSGPDTAATAMIRLPRSAGRSGPAAGPTAAGEAARGKPGTD